MVILMMVTGNKAKSMGMGFTAGLMEARIGETM